MEQEEEGGGGAEDPACCRHTAPPEVGVVFTKEHLSGPRVHTRVK